MHPRVTLRLLIGIGTLLVAVMSALAASQSSRDALLRISIDSTPEVGQFLVDGDGFTLYGKSSSAVSEDLCVGDCLDTWQPALVTDVIGFDSGVSLNLIGTLELSESATQVTYNGIPLFRYIDDLEPGQRNGQGIDEHWTLVSPDGELLELVAEDSDSAADEATVDPEIMETGAKVFADVCSSCHGANGNGGLGPRFVGNERLTDTHRIARMVINGSGYMPPVGRQMSDEDLAAVFTFIRNSWGNEFGPVAPEEVKAVR